MMKAAYDFSAGEHAKFSRLEASLKLPTYIDAKTIVRESAELGAKTINMVDDLIEQPLRVKGFEPLSRDEAHARE